MDSFELWNDFAQDASEYIFIDYKKKGVGSGHSKTGKRKRWRKDTFFEQDLLTHYQNKLSTDAFKATFAGYTPKQIDWFFNKIKIKTIRVRETEWHCRNKLMLWLDKLHNCLKYQQIAEKYRIGKATAKSHITDITKGILKSYENVNIVKFPDSQERQEMVKLLKQKGAPTPYALFSLDGSHPRCKGMKFEERLSSKHGFHPCFNVLFVIERVLGTICAFNIDSAATKHDITVLRESWFYKQLDEILDGWVILADKGYVGVYNDGVKCIAAVLKDNMEGRKHFSGKFWHKVNIARSDSERIFGDFFHNKFSQLGKWSGKSRQTYLEFSANVICCVILYNAVKFEFSEGEFLLSR